VLGAHTGAMTDASGGDPEPTVDQVLDRAGQRRGGSAPLEATVEVLRRDRRRDEPEDAEDQGGLLEPTGKQAG
jgi:hypothetical protein